MGNWNAQQIKMMLDKPSVNFHAEIFRECELRLFGQSKIDTIATGYPDIGGFTAYILNTIDSQTQSIAINVYEDQAYLVIDGVQGFCDFDQVPYAENMKDLREKLMLSANQVAYKII